MEVCEPDFPTSRRFSKCGNWPQFSIDAAGIGSLYIDNVTFRPVPAPASSAWTNWIPFGSTWRYFTNTPPANWYAASFNDASWQIGTAKFGAGSGPTNIVTRLGQLRPAYYFRKQFVAASADVEELLLSATCTDDSGTALYPIRVFLNGTEINSTIETVTAQGNEVRYFDLTPFAQLIKTGTNTLAVLLSNQWSTWDDIAFDVSLKAVPIHPIIPRLTMNAARFSVEASSGTIWQIQSCDDLRTGTWQLMQAFTNNTGGVQTFQDTGQNAGLLPGMCGAATTVSHRCNFLTG